MESFNVIVTEPVKAMLVKIWGYIPNIFAAIVILVVGWFIAKLIETIVARVLKLVRLDVASEKSGIAKMLAQGGIKATLSEIIGGIVFWVVIFVVIATAMNVVYLVIAADILSRLVAYVPNILGAIFILILGTLLASFVAAIVRTAASNAGIDNAKTLAEVTKIVLVIFAIIMAIEQLGIGVAIINLAVSIILASAGLAIAIAFGLGCKDIAGKAIVDMLNKMKK
jgi:hypothetical protein